MCVRLPRCILQAILNIHQQIAAKATTYANLQHSQRNVCAHCAMKYKVKLMVKSNRNKTSKSEWNYSHFLNAPCLSEWQCQQRVTVKSSIQSKRSKLYSRMAMSTNPSTQISCRFYSLYANKTIQQRNSLLFFHLFILKM